MRLEIWLKQIVENQEIRALFISNSEDISYVKEKEKALLEKQNAIILKQINYENVVALKLILKNYYWITISKF